MNEDAKSEHKQEPSSTARADDVEELRQVLGAIAEFLDKLSKTVRESLETVLSGVDGSRLGEDVGNFYKRLVESGIPPEEAMKLTEEYFRKRLDSVPSPSKLIETFSRFVKRPRAIITSGKVGERKTGTIENVSSESLEDKLEEVIERIREAPIPDEKKEEVIRQLKSIVEVMKDSRRERREGGGS
ncbi:hypothetical protein Pyrde_0925 [Pyrodictium delaneyi]|uniref:Uncharacterized protein n=1 Tax=Pyrodictium delaneyi TaxID=1273541 RepID=A0A0P0N3Y7_9CREN|nr:hypothetical protein [Pyrodictium delaneyi]ALL00973.1 hypothetical protein Pyrde_0925 [Pyrodictium delaneyi]OWJ55420.1 hypothetical protein Pdsh_01020 [Pyrodictium delaneyi]